MPAGYARIIRILLGDAPEYASIANQKQLRSTRREVSDNLGYLARIKRQHGNNVIMWRQPFAVVVVVQASCDFPNDSAHAGRFDVQDWRFY
jgi:hypothetical protein